MMVAKRMHNASEGVRREMMRMRSAMLVMAALGFTFQGGSMNAQEAPKSVVEQSLTVSSYRELAESTFTAFEQGEGEKAAILAGSLERSWDTEAGTIKVIAPTTWEAIDRAMDGFIDPLKRYRDKSPTTEEVRQAYRTYLEELKKAESLHWPTDNSLNLIKTTSGILCIVTKQGTGRQPKPGEIVILRVTGLANGTVFRFTKEGADPEWWWLLSDRHPLGVIEGMSLLHVGDSAVLIIPPRLGYGPAGGYKGVVPPNAQLTYVVDIVDVKSKEILSLLTDIINSRGVDAAIAEYSALQQKGFPDVYVNEIQMNQVGYYVLLDKKDAGGAVKIFKLNSEAHPHSANAFDSLGEAYVANGQKELAIDAYQKALSVNPKMESSIKALKRLQVGQQ
jgi:FKBP-type peptidyl-prolyl cis-trans isomerase